MDTPAEDVLGADPVYLIVPAFNEEASLAGLLREVRETLPALTVVVVDDGSEDATASVARRHGAEVLRLPFNVGYGAALQTGYKFALEAGAAFVVQMDADGQHLPGEIRTILDPVREQSCDLAVGSRFLDVGGYRMSRLRSIGRRGLSLLARLGGVEVSDPTSGFQAMNRRVAAFFARDWYPSDYPDLDVLVLARRAGFRVCERGVRMRPSGRESSLHSGLKPIYYFYKMLLSLWAGTSLRPASTPRAGQRGDESHG